MMFFESRIVKFMGTMVKLIIIYLLKEKGSDANYFTE